MRSRTKRDQRVPYIKEKTAGQGRSGDKSESKSTMVTRSAPAVGEATWIQRVAAPCARRRGEEVLKGKKVLNLSQLLCKNLIFKSAQLLKLSNLSL
jgi:hypothetical protein